MSDFTNPIEYSCGHNGDIDRYSLTQDSGQYCQFETLISGVPNTSAMEDTYDTFYANSLESDEYDRKITDIFKEIHEPKVEVALPPRAYPLHSWGTQTFGYSMPDNFDHYEAKEIDDSVSKAEDFLSDVVHGHANLDTLGPMTADEIPTSLIQELPSDLQFLASRGYVFLAHTLAARSDELHQKIREVSNPDLMEQLVNLAGLLESKITDGNQLLIANTMNTALLYGLRASQIGDEAYISHAEQVIGELSYLCNRSLDEVCMGLNSTDLDDSERFIHELFFGPLGPIARIKMAVKSKKEAHKKSKIQDASVAKTVQLPVLIAQELVMENGKINFGIIPILHNQLLGEDEPITLRGHKVNLFYGLDIMKKSPVVRARFQSISLPNNPYARENLLIRTVLGLPAGSALTDTDAKKTVLATMMSHLRQGNVGSCFGTFLGIELMISRLSQCMDDFAEILQTGKMIRTVNGEKQPFPYLMKMAYDSIYKKIEINSSGMLKEGGHLADSPGIQSALRQIGVPDEEMRFYVTEICQALFAGKSSGTESIKMDIKKFLYHVAETYSQVVPSLRGYEKEVLNQLRFGFEAETSPPLLRVWENILAGMAEGTENSNLMRRTLISTGQLLKAKVEQLDDAFSSGMFEKFIDLYVDTTLNRMKFLYDPDFEHDSTSSDGHSSAGAFVLYDTAGNRDPEDWIRIDAPYKFQDFMCFILKEIIPDMTKQIRGRFVEEKINSTIGTLQEYIASDRFIIDVAKKFNNFKYDEEVDLKKLELLKKSPWVSKMGNDPRYVDRVYNNAEELGSIETVQPYSAEHLLRRIIEKGRENRFELEDIFRNHPHKRIPIFTGTHAFTLVLGEPKLQQAWMGTGYIPELIENNLVIPGRAVSRQKLNPEAIAKGIEYCRNNCISKSNQEAFDRLVSKLPKEVWMTHFRSELMGIVGELEGLTREKYNLTTRRLDTCLFKNMDQKIRDQLLDQMVPFADTNWSMGKHDGLFSFIYNPFADRLEIALIGAKGEVIMLDQNDWMTMQQWEFFTSTTALNTEHQYRTPAEEILAG